MEIRMEKRSSNIFLQVLLVLVVLFLQLISIYFNQWLIYHLGNLEYGAQALGMALLSVGTGMASGIGTAFVFLRNQPKDRKKDQPVGAIFFMILSCLGILWKILFSAFGWLPFSVLRPVLSELYTWMMDSQLPSFWAGLVIGWFVNRERRSGARIE
jgi:hypothetical protein